MLRSLIRASDSLDHNRLSRLMGWLSSVLNSLECYDEATEALEGALTHANLSGRVSAIEAYSYLMANQYLNRGRPAMALQALVLPTKQRGHLVALTHLVEAKALAALGRASDASEAAARALSAAPTDALRAYLAVELHEDVK